LSQDRRTTDHPTTWDIIRSIWPVEERPEELQREAWVNSMSLDAVLMLKKLWDEQQKKENKGEQTFRRDAPLPTRLFDGGPDNCADLLHTVR